MDIFNIRMTGFEHEPMGLHALRMRFNYIKSQNIYMVEQGKRRGLSVEF